MKLLTARCVVIVGVLLALQVSVSDGRTLSRGEIAQELVRQGFPRHQLADWVCLVEHESSGRTHVIGPPNSDGSQDYGLFQINNYYWCDQGSRGCGIRCSELLTDNISVAARCAMQIYNAMGFRAWNAWTTHCQGSLPDVTDYLGGAHYFGASHKEF